MFEPGQPWYVMTPQEIHAAGYGLFEGLKFWKRRVTPYNEIPTLGLSPEWTADIQAKYHYYRTCFEIPETVVLLAVVGYFVANHADLALQAAVKILGA